MKQSIAAALMALGMGAGAWAQVGIGSSGLPSYTVPIAVPPGIAGMTPQLSLLFSGGGFNGPEGYGWSLQGTSAITRCPSVFEIDGSSSPVTYGAADRLCLDGQRLVRTDEAGTPKTTTDDGNGVAGTGYVEYRTEKDSFVRVRAYGYWGNAQANGPKWFRVWTKSGQIFDYGAAPANASGLIVVEKVGAADADRPVMAWGISRQSDTLGNYIDFKYTRRSIKWGSGTTAGSPTAGAEWYVSEILYTGFSGSPARLPANRIVFDYADRPLTFSDRPYDAAEAYQAGYKSVSVGRLKRIRSFVGLNDPKAPVPVLVRTVTPTYENSPVTGRSRITQIKECFGESTTTAGEPGTKCTQATQFDYADTGGTNLDMNTAFNLSKLPMLSTDGSVGVLTADFNGDGRTDILRWHSTDAAQNQLHTSDGDGSFTKATLNLPHLLFSADGCYYSSVIDMNADGLPDIMRFAGKTNYNGNACQISGNGISHVFINNGAGGFAPREIQIKVGGADPVPAPLKRQVSKDLTQQYCNPPNLARQAAGAPGAQPLADCRTGRGWTYGANFYFLDVNLDGRPDLVTTELPARYPADPADEPNIVSCEAGVTCSHVYIDDGNGLLVENTNTNVANKSLYSNPGLASDYQYVKHIGNVDGDALADLVSVGKENSAGHWRSDGKGNFALSGGAGNCDRPIDFNGDGRLDCLYGSKTGASYNALYASTGSSTAYVADFNLKTAGYELEPPDSLPVGQRYGHFVIDLNGDDRGDIFRWHDDQTKNKLLLSNGNGTFREATPGGYTITRFMASSGNFSTVQGDFLGQGTPQMLRLSTAAANANDASGTNNLYYRSQPMVPDRLVSVTSGTGLVTSLTYATVANAPTGRFVSDRGGSNDAAYPTMDVAFPMPIVTTVEMDTGVGTNKLKTEYAYLGLKADAKGQGMLGFRERRTQSSAPNGSAMTTATQYHQRRPYAGLTRRNESRQATLAGFDAATTLSRTINIYCDKTSSTAPTSATEATPCATSAKVTRPYQYKGTDTGYDIDAAHTALPTVTTTSVVDNQGNATEVTVTTSGTFDGTARSYTKVTTNVYTSDTSGDRWILGRLTDASVHSTVPNLNLTPSVGTAPYGNWTDGGGVNQGAAPAQTETPSVTKPASQKRKTH